MLPVPVKTQDGVPSKALENVKVQLVTAPPPTAVTPKLLLLPAMTAGLPVPQDEVTGTPPLPRNPRGCQIPGVPPSANHSVTAPVVVVKLAVRAPAGHVPSVGGPVTAGETVVPQAVKMLSPRICV